jgi:HAD superfamily hydrolase (TIGR01509 family)
MNCWLELAAKYGIKNIEQPYLACTGTTMAKTKEIMLAAYGADFPYDAYAKEASRMYHDKYDGGRLPMKKGVVELLTYLKKAGKKIALASSTRSETVIAQLKDADIFDFFDAVLCGDMVEKSKPAPDIFLRACQELGTQPERTYGIEDSYNGVRALQAGKLRPIMVPDLLPCDEEMQEMTDVVLDNLLDVMEYLEKREVAYDK